jgi:hypothetical protein
MTECGCTYDDLVARLAAAGGGAWNVAVIAFGQSKRSGAMMGTGTRVASDHAVPELWATMEGALSMECGQRL